MKKIAIPVNITNEEREQLAAEGIFVYENAMDRLENTPARDIAKLAKELAQSEPDNDFLKATKIILTLPRISLANEDLLVEIEGKNYYIVDQIKGEDKTITFEADTGKLIEFSTSAIESIIKKPSFIQDRTLREVNKSINKFNTKVDNIQKSIGMSKIPLQANSAKESIEDRIEELSQQISALENKKSKEYPSYQSWKNKEVEKAKSQNLNETDTIDTLLFQYQNQPDILRQKIENNEIDVNPKIKTFLLSLLTKEHQKIQDGKIKDISEQISRELRQEENFEPDSTLEHDKIKNLTLEDLPQGNPSKLMKFKGPESAIAQNAIMISEIKRDKKELEIIRNSLENIQQYIGHLESGHRSSDYLQSEEGLKVLTQIKSFMNDAGRFCKRYKEKPIENGTINQKLFGRKGTIGNALLASELNKFCLSLNETIKSYTSLQETNENSPIIQSKKIQQNMAKRCDFSGDFWNNFINKYLSE